jgi:Single-stranded DNA-binding protein
MFKVVGVGRLGRDAETRKAGDTTVTGFSVALDGYARGEKITTWVDCTLWGESGTKVAHLLTKGTSIGIVGTGRLEVYTKRDGSQGAKITCRLGADDWSFAGPRQDAAPASPSAQQGGGFSDDGVPF